MADFHRLTTPSYLGGMPGSHDYINNTPGDPSQAPADGAKSGGPNAGTLFVAFGEAGTSSNTNRANKALAQNDDFIDNVISAEMPVPAELTVTAPGGVVTTYQLMDDVFVGISGVYLDTTEWKDKLIRVVDPTTGNEILGSGNLPVRATAIKDNTNTSNVVGSPASGFYTNPYLTLTPGVPTGVDFKIIYGKRSSLVKVIKDKTNLDALTRVALPGSPQVVGEVERFMHEAARRSGSIQALAAAIIETPGQGDNIGAKSATMYLDLDPDATYTTASHQWNLRGHRDGTPRNYLRFRNQLLGGPELYSPDYGLKIGDVYTTAGKGGVPIGDAGNDQFKYLDKNGGGLFNPSLLNVLNSRWTVTVGDGTNSFGDFDSIGDAVTFFKSNPISTANYGHGAVILLKAGAHAVADVDIDVLVGSTQHTGVTIMGCSKEGCIITVNGLTAGFISENKGCLTLQNVTLVAGACSTAVKLGSRGKLRMYDCAVYNLGLLVDKTLDDTLASFARIDMVSLLAERCVFHCPSLSAPIISFSLGSSVDTRGYIFVDCYMQAISANYPICKIADKVGATGARLSNVRFVRCWLRPAGSEASGGVMTGVGGVLEAAPLTTGGLKVTDITWEDCDVVSHVNGGAINCSPLMYLRTEDSSSNYIDFDDLAIVGGKWKVVDDSVIIPFYIGGKTGAMTDTHRPLRVHLKNVEIGYDTTVSRRYGSATTELSGLGSAADIGAFSLVPSYDVYIHNVRYTNPTVRSGSGDIFIRCSELHGYSLHFDRTGWVDTINYGTPSHRVRVEYCSGLLEDLRIIPPTLSSAALSKGALWISFPYGLEVLRATIAGFNTSSESGIYMSWEGSDREAGSIIDCVVGNCSQHGFHLEGTGSGSDLEGLQIRGNNFLNNGMCGIFIYAPDSPTALTIEGLDISNNYCANNGDFGIAVFLGLYGVERQEISVCNNICRENNGAADAIQIQFGFSDSEAYGRDFYGVVMGNNCGGTAAGYGKIAFTYDGPPPAPTGSLHMRGAETETELSAGFMAYYYVDTHPMMQNRAAFAWVAV